MAQTILALVAALRTAFTNANKAGVEIARILCEMLLSKEITRDDALETACVTYCEASFNGAPWLVDENGEPVLKGGKAQRVYDMKDATLAVRSKAWTMQRRRAVNGYAQFAANAKRLAAAGDEKIIAYRDRKVALHNKYFGPNELNIPKTDGSAATTGSNTGSDKPTEWTAPTLKIAAWSGLIHNLESTAAKLPGVTAASITLIQGALRSVEAELLKYSDK